MQLLIQSSVFGLLSWAEGNIFRTVTWIFLGWILQEFLPNNASIQVVWNKVVSHTLELIRVWLAILEKHLMQYTNSLTETPQTVWQEPLLFRKGRNARMLKSLASVVFFIGRFGFWRKGKNWHGGICNFRPTMRAGSTQQIWADHSPFGKNFQASSRIVLSPGKMTTLL